MNIEHDGNLIEAGVWGLLAIGLCIHAARSEKRLRPTLVLLAVTMIVFGGSDIVESRTGAWWRPWWLFAWKSACVITLLLGFVRFYRLRRTRVEEGPSSPPSANT